MSRDSDPALTQSGKTRAQIVYLCLITLALSAGPGLNVYAQDDTQSRLKRSNRDEVSYRFLGSGSGSSEDSDGDGERGSFGYDEMEGDAQLKAIPVETAEELRRREKIRNVLRLVEGDSVQVTTGVRVKMIGIDAPEYRGEQGRRSYQIFAAQAKKWLKSFMEDPYSAMGEYEGMDTQVNYVDKSGEEFTYYYLYMPEQLLEDIRNDELQEYDRWLKEKADKLKQETDAMKKKHRADITGMGIEDLPESQSSGGNTRGKEYMIKEQLYYYEDGSVQREEIMRDGKLMIMRKFDRQGNVIDEVFYDTRMRPMKRS